MAINYFCKQLVKEGFINPPHVSVPEQNPYTDLRSSAVIRVGRIFGGKF